MAVSTDRTEHRLLAGLKKSATGIPGLDEITGGGLPAGRTTLVCGTAGSGKTLLSLQFLVYGAAELEEPGVFMSFEERPDDLVVNVASLGVDLAALVAGGHIYLDHVEAVPDQSQATGDFDLEGLFVRLAHAIDRVGAKRVVLDTLEVLFQGQGDGSVVRGELRRLFRWLSERGVTAIVTAEAGLNSLTRYGIEEYVSDCVLSLHQDLDQGISTRRLRVVKYRGSQHGSNECPFLIDAHGVALFAIKSSSLDHPAGTARLSSGVAKLDQMLGGKGFLEGSAILVSGHAGSGKGSLCAHFADAACARGQRCLYLALEESPMQIARNMRSIGIDIEHWQQAGLLTVRSLRPTGAGLEWHLMEMQRLVQVVDPAVVVVDQIGAFDLVGRPIEVRAMLTRLTDFLKSRSVTVMMSTLIQGETDETPSQTGISSLIDSWIVLRNVEYQGERNRTLSVLKSRGMAHSNQVREFLVSDHGVDLIDVQLGPGGVLLGSARLAAQTAARATREERGREAARQRAVIERKRVVTESAVIQLQTQFQAEQAELEAALEAEATRLGDLRMSQAASERERSTNAAEQAPVAARSRKRR